MPPHNTVQQPVPIGRQQELAAVLKQILDSIEDVNVDCVSTPPGHSSVAFGCYTIEATEDTWTRAARRRRQKERETRSQNDATTPVALICGIQLHYEVAEAKSGPGEPYVQFQWIQGRDRALFESFCSHVSRKITSVS